jgi:glutamate dehydrogenase
VQALLHITADHITPPELMRAVLRLDTDLLFFGGIGTYVRASDQGNDEAGDRSNDALRITGAEIGAKVIGEGANLGMTQRGRIEAARRGVRLNTDAIDNSAGVNTSDMEVNIKIALSLPVADGRLSGEDRDSLLAEMTDEVAELVLANKYRQTLALSLTERRGLEDLGFEQRLMQELEGKGALDRAVEFLPDDKALAERARNEQPLTRPEIAVLLAYAKLTLGDALLSSEALEESYFSRQLLHYFPTRLAERFPEALTSHRLRREIIATLLANAMIDLGGPSFVPRTGHHEEDAGALAKAFTLVSDALRIGDFIRGVDSLDARVPSALQIELYGSLQELLLTRVSWALANVDLSTPLEELVARFRTSADAMIAGLDHALPQDVQERLLERRTELEAAGVPEDDAARLALIPVLYGAPDSALIAEQAGCDAAEALGSLSAAANWLGLGRLRETVKTLPVNDYYERRALDRAVAQIGGAERALAIAAARQGGGEAGMEAWVKDRPQALDVRAEIAEMARSGMTFAKLAVAGALLSDLTRE